MFDDLTVWLNGELVPFARAAVPVLSHSHSRGSAVFEAISAYRGPAGMAVFRLDLHVKRLLRTVELLGMQLDYSAEEIAAAVKETIRANRPAEAAAIRVLGYYSVVTLEVDRPAGPLDLFVMAADAARLGEAPDGRTIAACFSTWRKLSGDMVPVEAKTAANYLNGMMVREDAKSRGFDQGITLDADGAVAEGSTESVFMVKDGVLRTPPLGRILRSITRLTIIEAARADGLVVDDGPVAPEEMLAADEIFTACTPLKVLPVHRFEDRDLTAPGPVTSRLDALLADICRGRDERFKDWLFPVD